MYHKLFSKILPFFFFFHGYVSKNEYPSGCDQVRNIQSGDGLLKGQKEASIFYDKSTYLRFLGTISIPLLAYYQDHATGGDSKSHGDRADTHSS